MSRPAPDARADAVLGGRITLKQPASGYRAAIDPVFLAAAAAPVAADEAALDLGCGVGTAALCYGARVAGPRIVGLELQPALAALARENARANGMAERFRPLTGDLLAPPPEVPGNGFALVMANPPHLAADAADLAPEAQKAVATVEGAAALEDWIGFGLSRLRPGGRLVLIHRADRLADILAALGGRAGDIAVYPLWPKAGRPAKRVIVAARKGARGGASVLPGMILHAPDGSYTEAAERVLREAGNISLTN